MISARFSMCIYALNSGCSSIDNLAGMRCIIFQFANGFRFDFRRKIPSISHIRRSSVLVLRSHFVKLDFCVVRRVISNEIHGYCFSFNAFTQFSIDVRLSRITRRRSRLPMNLIFRNVITHIITSIELMCSLFDSSSHSARVIIVSIFFLAVPRTNEVKTKHRREQNQKTQSIRRPYDSLIRA